MESIHDISKEKERLQWYRKNKPEALILPQLEKSEVFARIGINANFPDYENGYIKLHPTDFIVEEINEKNEISQIEPEQKDFVPSFPLNLGCDLIKTGISTFDALNILANILHLKNGRITYAGIKDVNAVTSQKIVFQNINSDVFEQIKRISLPNILLANFTSEKKGLSAGNLIGNKFTIFIRTKDDIDEQELFLAIEKVKTEGFLNFYSVQRFGTPRFISHYYGMLILQGKYEEAVYNFFTKEGLQETPLIREIRKNVEKIYGNWAKMEEIYIELPFTFRNELQLLSYLKKEPNNFIGALIFLKDQTKFWIYAYTSYLFNQIISQKNVDLPEEIPLALSYHPDDMAIYKFWIEHDGIGNFANNLRPFKFITIDRRFVKTRIFPKNVLAKITPQGIALSFSLEKGVYATTFLANFFEIREGLPMPEWVKTDEVDAKKLLGIGSLEAVKDIFKKNLSSRAQLY